tara:strand:+ start:2266 stop:3126 length:861 start_codon:yes stop_codon:yes gene_type:complete
VSEQSILSKYKRQPKIYITLPSGGKFYADNPMEKSGSGEIPVYSMTAKDELLIKTPDALMNGEATVEVIKSCCPLISDPWQMPIIDIDAILIAIRIATYGEQMEINVPITGIEPVETETFTMDLRALLDGMQGKTWTTEFTLGELTFDIAPLTYKQSTDLYQGTYESQRLASIMQREDIPDQEKMEAFREGFKKLSAQNLELVLKHIKAIKTADGSEANPKAIREFFDNTDKETFTQVSDFLEKNRNDWQIKPQIYKVPAEYVEKGAPEEIQVPLVFDQSNFFASK